MNIIKNSFYIIFGIFVVAILNYVFHIYVGRVLGPVDYGVFGALLSLFMILAFPVQSISSGIAKFTAKFNSNKKYNIMGLLRKKIEKRVLIYGIILFLIITLFSKHISNYLKIDSVIPIITVGITLIFAMILPVNRGILQGMKKFKSYSFNLILESFFRLILVIILLFFGLEVNGAILSYGLAYFIAFIMIFPFIKEVRKIESEKFEKINEVYKFILLVLIVNVILQLIINAPTIFIKHYMGSEFTGYWTAALTLARISLFVALGIILVMFPEVSGNSNIKEQKRLFRNAFILTLVTTGSIALLYFFIPQIFVASLYGKAYLGAVPILKWMGLAMIGFASLQLKLNYWLARKD